MDPSLYLVIIGWKVSQSPFYELLIIYLQLF